MSAPPSEPMDGEMTALLRGGVADFDAPAGARARVLGRLSAQIPELGALVRPPASSLPSDSGVGNPPTRPEGTGSFVQRVLHHGSRFTRTELLTATVTAAFLAGGAGFLAAHTVAPTRGELVSTNPPSFPAIPPAPEPSPPMPLVTTEGTAASSLAALAPAPSAAPAATEAPPRGPSPMPSGQVAERRLLDEARTALLQGDGLRCLHTAERHRARFPSGVFREERDALILRALLSLGRQEEAAAELTRFQARYPESLLRSALESAVERGATP